MFNMTKAPMANNSTQVQNNKEVNKVYKTNDYDLFKKLMAIEQLINYT